MRIMNNEQTPINHQLVSAVAQQVQQNGATEINDKNQWQTECCSPWRLNGLALLTVHYDIDCKHILNHFARKNPRRLQSDLMKT